MFKIPTITLSILLLMLGASAHGQARRRPHGLREDRSPCPRPGLRRDPFSGGGPPELADGPLTVVPEPRSKSWAWPTFSPATSVIRLRKAHPRKLD